MQGNAPHVLFRRAEFSQRFNLNQRAILNHAADTKLIVIRWLSVIRGMLRPCGSAYLAIHVFHRGNLV